MLSKKINKILMESLWIKEMFEEGRKQTEIFGEDKVFDFSMGNPVDEPPKEVIESLIKHASEKGIHRYMDFAGYPEVRERIAQSLQKNSGVGLSAHNIVMTVGAGGGLNVVLKAILNQGDEVIVFAPYFPDYYYYIDNHGGNAVVVPPDITTFEPCIDSLERAITAKTKALIINTPNNPTGVIYNEKKLLIIKEIINKKEQEYGTTIFLISDQPYHTIIFDEIEIPNILSIFENGIIVDSFSKSLALAGERIGYIAASSNIRDINLLMTALSFCNRTLGFVNAPGLFQKVVGDSLDVKVDIKNYQIKRDFLYENLIRLGYQCVMPKGAFYLFPRAPIEDDFRFVKKAITSNLIVLPGSGFGCSGYFRIAYSVKMDTIINSIPIFEKMMNEFK